MAYRELVQADEHVACLWIRDAEPEGRRHRILPDACVDVVWTDGRLVVAGPATGAAILEVPAGAVALGVRFRVGAAGAALGLPAGELIDARPALEDVWGSVGAEIAERVGEAATPAARLHALAAAVRERLAAPPDDIVRAAATGTPRGDLGISDRQLRRRFGDAVGYGPKTLERILRFQRFLALAGDGAAAAAATAARGNGARPDLARLALEAGYADQAHLTRECSRLAGLPPAALLASGAGPAGDKSVSFDTDRTNAATIAA
jgi:AraC-like DNA-binding protein